eukprot:COSAG01_NODE_56081_length_320_cov_6.348416_2_plen_49_part_01
MRSHARLQLTRLTKQPPWGYYSNFYGFGIIIGKLGDNAHCRARDYVAAT